MRTYKGKSPVMARAPSYDAIVAAIAHLHGSKPERIVINGEQVIVEGILKTHSRVVAYGREWRYESGPPRK